MSENTQTAENTTQNPGIIGTVMSYIPGWQASGTATEDHKKTSEHSEEESHSKKTTGGAEQTGTTTAGNTTAGNTTVNPSSTTAGNDNTSLTGTGQSGATDSDQSFQARSGLQGDGFTTDNAKVGTGSANAGGHHHSSGTGTGGVETGVGNMNVGDKSFTNGSGANNGTSGASNTSSAGQTAGQSDSPSIEYEEDTGTHDSGYTAGGGFAGGGSSQSVGAQKQDNGVHGAPIEGDGVKGYAIGAPVGSGDTERPNAPGDPSGQVSGAHVEYNPETTDTRDSRGRGTVNNSHGTGDSSFANVKTDDGQGNSSHVMSRSNESHISHSSVTQM